MEFTFAAFDPEVNTGAFGVGPAMLAGRLANGGLQRLSLTKGAISGLNNWPILLFFEDPKFNHVKLRVQNRRVTFAVNGMGPVTFAAPPHGEIGLIVLANEPNTSARFDNFKLMTGDCIDDESSTEEGVSGDAVNDSDGDGVPDDEDYCPNYPGKEETDGC